MYICIYFQALLVRSMARESITLTPVELTAVITLTFRPLISSQMSDKLVSLFLINILSVPSLVYHLNKEDFDKVYYKSKIY